MVILTYGLGLHQVYAAGFSIKDKTDLYFLIKIIILFYFYIKYKIFSIFLFKNIFILI